MKEGYLKRGFQESTSPNIYNHKSWMISGQCEHYHNNMFRPYREWPFKTTDFGILHKNEILGAPTRLTRVRMFQQDNTHIKQIKSEMTGYLDFIKHVHYIFGFIYRLRLSNRPKKFLGNMAVWDKVGKDLAGYLDNMRIPWKLSPVYGALYGPKTTFDQVASVRVGLGERFIGSYNFMLSIFNNMKISIVYTLTSNFTEISTLSLFILADVPLSLVTIRTLMGYITNTFQVFSGSSTGIIPGILAFLFVLSIYFKKIEGLFFPFILNVHVWRTHTVFKFEKLKEFESWFLMINLKITEGSHVCFFENTPFLFAFGSQVVL